MAASEPPERDDAELVAGRYRITERIGSGGMASVYAAEDTVLDRVVALKRLRTDAADDQVARFRREARIGAGLNHHNLASVYDIVSEGDAVVIVMEYVEGRSLEDLLDVEGRLPADRALPILRELGAALDYAHDAGIVHRDIKPANVLITEDGRAKLVDLGIASAAEETRLTAAHQVVGTLSYMPPERLSAETPGDRASDVYSLAMLALQMLSGELPWRGFDPAERLKHAERDAPEMTATWPEGPTEARAAIAKSLDPDPQLRHASAGALIEDLERAIAAGDAERVPTEPTEQVDRAPTPLPGAAKGPAAGPRFAGPRTIFAGLVAVAILAVAAVIALSGGGDGGGPASEQAQSDRPAQGSGQEGEPAPNAEEPQSEEPAESEDVAPADDSSPDPASYASGGPEDDARGARLNDQGFALIQSGQPEQAVPVLRRAVRAFAAGTDDIRYAYALYNLGNALRLSGNPGEAIPVLEARLQIPNQTAQVEQELDAARAEAS